MLTLLLYGGAFSAPPTEKWQLLQTRSDILQGQALFRGVKLLLTRGVW